MIIATLRNLRYHTTSVHMFISMAKSALNLPHALCWSLPPAPWAPFPATRCGSTWQRDFGCERKDAAFDAVTRQFNNWECHRKEQETRCKTGMNWRELNLSLDHLHHVSHSISPTYFKILGRNVLVDKSWQNDLCTTCPISRFSALGVWYFEASSTPSLYP